MSSRSEMKQYAMKSGFNVEISDLYQTVKHLQENGCAFQYFEGPGFDGRTITVNNRKLLHFASCSYLGLETHPVLINGSVEAVRRYGTQTPSSRAMLSSPLYRELEEQLKLIFPGHVIVTQTVTLAHCSVLPLLIGEKDAIILDAYVHNSVRMASQLCRANGTFIIVSRHNDMEHVRYLIYRLKKDGYRNIWYCADGIYSIHGNMCDVAGLQKLLDEEENFYAYVDDAHGTGWCGKNGSGYVIGSYGLHEKMIVVESFAKSMVSSGGGIVVPDRLIADYIGLTGQTMIFSGPIQPAILGSLVACVKLHLTGEIAAYQNELLGLIRYLRQRSRSLGLPVVTNDETPIQLLRIGSMEKTYRVLKGLIERGYFPMTAGYPAIAKGDEGIRITVTRHLTKEDIDGFLSSVQELI
ncbi:MAG: aminotransferase class I/II-fold pyridoxal phosphate-dependent enzyme [Bacteroidales bacterium]|nr:aminotransferase class I/II-fold pyridoxal phosphate-dependent enzyme [Bacteroidales bacterium]